MALDTYASIWGNVLQRCPNIGALFAQNSVRNAFRRVYERRRWSWLVKPSQFIVPGLTNAGTVDVTINSTLVTGHGTSWTSALVGQQFRVGVTAPIYDIAAVNSTTSLTLSQPFAFTQSFTGIGYQIYQAFFTVPSDFHAFVSLWDPNFNWQLNLNIDQREINAYDAQRANFQQAYVVSFRDYNQTQSPPLPRYELWPHVQIAYVYPFLYESRPADISDSGATLPRYVRGDVLMEMALEDCARYPGTNDLPNPYFNMNLAISQAGRAEKMIQELERQDDEVYVQMASYGIGQLPYAPLPWGDSRWLQSHDLGLY